MKKNVIKLNENTLRQIVAESVKKVLKENEGKAKTSCERKTIRVKYFVSVWLEEKICILLSENVY